MVKIFYLFKHFETSFTSAHELSTSLSYPTKLLFLLSALCLVLSTYSYYYLRGNVVYILLLPICCRASYFPVPPSHPGLHKLVILVHVVQDYQFQCQCTLISINFDKVLVYSLIPYPFFESFPTTRHLTGADWPPVSVFRLLIHIFIPGLCESTRCWPDSYCRSAVKQDQQMFQHRISLLNLIIGRLFHILGSPGL